MNMYAAIIGLIILILGGGYFALQSSSEMKKDAMENDPMQKAEMAKEEMMEDSGNMQDAIEEGEMMQEDHAMESETMKKDGTMMDKGDAAHGTIEVYSPEKLALAKTGKVLLFFHADWCPVCRGLDKEEAANPNIAPGGVHVLKVNYDTETALKQKYGVTYQHTFVQVDAAGALIQKFGNALSYADVFSRVK